MRKVILTIALTSIVLLATQAALFVHLVFEKEHGEHDPHNCPVCKQLSSLVKKPAFEEDIEIYKIPHFETGFVFQSSVIPPVFTFQTVRQRAPPACL
jgi:hypothetical protein